MRMLLTPLTSPRSSTDPPRATSVMSSRFSSTAAAVTMLMAPGPIDVVQAIIRFLRIALA